MNDDRRDERHPAPAWSVRALVSDCYSSSGRAADVPVHGLPVFCCNRLPSGPPTAQVNGLQANPDTSDDSAYTGSFQYVSLNGSALGARERFPVTGTGCDSALAAAAPTMEERVGIIHSKLGVAPGGTNRTEGRGVLVVEDDAGFREVLTDSLADEGYRVIQARTPDEAFAALGGDCPRLVLLGDPLPDNGRAGRVPGVEAAPFVRGFLLAALPASLLLWLGLIAMFHRLFL